MASGAYTHIHSWTKVVLRNQVRWPAAHAHCLITLAFRKLYIHTCIHTYTYIYIHTHIYSIHYYTYISTYVCHVYTFTCTSYIHINTNTRTHTNRLTHTHMHIETHKYTCRQMKPGVCEV